jgi:gas vesicle protein
MTAPRIYYSDEAERVARRQQITNVLLFMALGMGIGAIVAILFAPDQGDKTRKAITHAMEDGYKRGRESTRDALKQLEPEFPNLREKVDGLMDKIKR